MDDKIISVAFPARLPLDVKEFVQMEARENGSSQNSEIIRALRAAMKAKGVAEAATSPRPHSTYTTERK